MGCGQPRCGKSSGPRGPQMSLDQRFALSRAKPLLSLDLRFFASRVGLIGRTPHWVRTKGIASTRASACAARSCGREGGVAWRTHPAGSQLSTGSQAEGPVLSDLNPTQPPRSGSATAVPVGVSRQGPTNWPPSTTFCQEASHPPVCPHCRHTSCRTPPIPPPASPRVSALPLPSP